jgi:hypothetical protein
VAEQRAFWLRWVDSDDAAALLLALAALGTAWSGYQASIWSGIQSAQYTYSSVLRGKAGARADEVARLRMLDAAMFTKWLEAFAERRDTLALYYERHFRPEFQPAFERWRTRVMSRDLAATPFEGEDYRRATSGDVAWYDSAATRALNAGQRANDICDRYVFVTVILASVLFFAGSVRPLVQLRWRALMMAIAGLLCLWAAVRLMTTPVTS